MLFHKILNLFNLVLILFYILWHTPLLHEVLTYSLVIPTHLLNLLCLLHVNHAPLPKKVGKLTGILPYALDLLNKLKHWIKRKHD